jgi:hypothetical protein
MYTKFVILNFGKILKQFSKICKISSNFLSTVFEVQYPCTLCQYMLSTHIPSLSCFSLPGKAEHAVLGVQYPCTCHLPIFLLSHGYHYLGKQSMLY